MRSPTPGSRPGLAFLFSIVLAISLAAAGHATTLRVPLDQPDVRAAVAAAATGDTVLLSPGVHPGGAFINGKALTIASRYLVTGDTSLVTQTVLTGDANGGCGGVPGCNGNSVLEFGATAGGSAVVGLTLSKGENGVGSASSVDVLHCRVISNGDGVDYTTGSGGTFRSNQFLNNRDDGIDLNGHMNMTIVDNDIRDNGDDGIEYRMNAYAGPALEVDILDNRISGNHEDGVQLIDYPGNGNYAIRIERNLFQSNFDPSGLSAAIAFMPNGETIETLAGAASTRRTYVTNNTFIGEKNGLVGGANVIALNNILTGINGIALSRVSGNSICSYTLLWSCGTNYSQSVIDTTHVMFGNPQLNGSARLTPASPAINAGIAVFQWRGETVLNLPPASFADGAPDLGAYESAPNTPPLVSAGPDRTVSLSTDVEDAGAPNAPPMRADAPMAGTVSDDGLPYPPSPSILWTMVGGAGPVWFQDPMSPAAIATFSVAGTYVLQLTVNDGRLTSSDLVTITVLAPINMPPAVDAGRDLSVTLPARAQPTGTVMDDGLPSPPGALSTMWTTVRGPGQVTFFGATLLSPRVAFSMPGTYVLQLTASDGAASASDTVTVTVLPVPNDPPVVSAGPDQTFMFPLDANLDGTVTDDGRPNPPATLTTTWTVAGGPGAVTFQDPAAVDTRASFAAPGTYTLELTASDGSLSASDLVQVVVQSPPPAFEARIAAAGDDAEEDDRGRMGHGDNDLDLVYDFGNQIVGLRFANVTVPPGAIVLAATVQFAARQATSDVTSLTLRAQAADSAPTFGITRQNLSQRPLTEASAGWTPPPWTTADETGSSQRTSDLTAVIQEIIDRPGWASGNPLAIIITGTGHRVAHSFETSPPDAALLHIEYGGLAVPAGASEVVSAIAAAPAAPTGPFAAAIDPPRVEFALRGVTTQPARGPLVVAFALPEGGRAVLELHDVSGRSIATRDVGGLGPGVHTVELAAHLPPGVYLVRLTQGPLTRVRKAIVLP